MPSRLSRDDPNLQAAAGRLRRISLIWAALFTAMGLISLRVLGATRPLDSLAWLAVAALLFISQQPAFLPLVSAQSSLSLIALLPGLSESLGPEPLSTLLGSGGFETVGLAVVRLGIMVTAWNQFLFYRMLYGTERASGLDPDLPVIPEVVVNQSDRIATSGAVLGALALILALSVPVLPLELAARHGPDLALGLATLAFGLGLGAAFSPTERRNRALLGIGTGMAGFLLSIAVRLIGGG